MEDKHVKERILKCLQNIGCEYDDHSFQPFADLIENSIMFIAFIVELEDEFFIEVPDEFLVPSTFLTIEDVCNMVDMCLELKPNEDR